jgi:predicted TIM-barrel fold metal-dependent hydrolase
VPGCLDLLFRGQIPEGVDPRTLMKVEPLAEHPEYRGRDARVDVMDRQGLEAALLFPTLGCGVEEALKGDVDATMASLHAFNRWLEDDWGYDHLGRVIAAPMISLADPEAAAAEVDRVLAGGARIVHVRPAPVPGPNGRSYSLGHQRHDPVWARLAEAGVPVAFHLGDSGYNGFLAAAWGGRATFGFGASDPLSHVLVADRPIQDTIASLVMGGVFTRHPQLKVASIENGSDWVHVVLKHLRKQANQTPWAFAEDPLDTVRAHVWITPYYEEDIRHLAEVIGVERVLFGSDWPHGEALAEPLDFLAELNGFAEADVRRIMRDNVLELLGARVATAA